MLEKFKIVHPNHLIKNYNIIRATQVRNADFYLVDVEPKCT